jgi:hypothetical protein
LRWRTAIDAYQPVGQTPSSTVVLVLIQDRDQVESGSRLPGHSPVAMP